MGIDLSLHPIDHDRGGWIASFTVLRVEQDYELFERIRSQAPQCIPRGLHVNMFGAERVTDGYHKGERIYGSATTDSYGDPYTWIRAGDLLVAFRSGGGPPWTVAYLRALPPETRIVLDWH